MSKREESYHFMAACPACGAERPWSATAGVAETWDWTRVGYAISCPCSKQPVVTVLWPMTLTEYIAATHEGFQESA